MKSPIPKTAVVLSLLSVLLAFPARAVTNVTHYELNFDAMTTGTTTGGDLTAAASGATWSLHTGRGANYTISSDAALTSDQAFTADDPDASGNASQIIFYTISLDAPIALDPATTVTISFRIAPTRSGVIKGLRFRLQDSSDVDLGDVYWVDESASDAVRLKGSTLGTSTFTINSPWNSTGVVRPVTLTVTSTSLGVNFNGVTGSASHSRGNVAKLRVYSDGSNGGAKGLQLADLKFTRSVSAPNAVASGAAPADLATEVGVGLTALTWDAPALDATHDAPTNYIVYFGTNPTVTSNPSYNTATPSLATPGLSLATSTTYYWRADAQNEDGITPGTTWQFTTASGSTEITASSTFPASVSTTYGTASPSTSVAVSGSTLSGDITATAPTGFEVSNDDSTWGSTTTFTQSGGSASGTLYVRLKNNAPVAGSYDSANVVLSSPGATSVSVATPASANAVSPKALNVVSATALDKMYDGTTVGTVIGTLDTAEAFGEGNSADGKPYTGDALSVSAPGTFASSAVGTGISVTAGTFTLSGAAAGNYTVTPPALSLSAAIRDTAVWTQLTGGSWTNSNNWQNGVVGSGTGNNADFTTLLMTASRTVTLDGPRTIGNLWFGDQSGTNYGWTLNSGSGGPLTLAVNSGTPVISNSVFTTIIVQIAGSQGFEKTGSGTLRLNNTANPVTGEILVSSGTLQMRDGSVNAPTVFAAATMEQRSLRITGTGVEELFRTATGAETVTWTLPATTLENGGTLRCRNGNDYAYTHNIDSAFTIGTGGGVIASTGPTKNQTIALSGALSGSGALSFAAQDAASGFYRALRISSANNTYSGDWTVSQSGAGTAYLTAAAANALGTGTVTLGTRATLQCTAAGGLNSLAGVTLKETSSTLDLSANPWNNASATLIASNGTIQLGTAASEIGAFTVNSPDTVTLTGTGGSLLATDTEVQAGTLTLADGAQLRFRIGNHGENNQLKGVGTVNLNGVFNLDVSVANTAVGNAWALVDVANLTETFGATFSVTSTAGAFTETAPGVWKKQINATTRYVFAEATGVLSVQANNAPVAQEITMGVAQGGGGTLLIIGGKFAPADVDGDILTVSLPSATTSNGAAVSTDASSVTVDYSGVSSFSGTDHFDYMVNDGFGGTVTETVTVLVSAGGNGANIISLSGTAPNITVNFAGMPASTYAIERATSASGPWTEIAASVSTGTNGLGSYVDTSAPSPTGFYRTRHMSTP